METYDQLKNGDKTLEQVEEDQKKIYIRIKWNNKRLEKIAGTIKEVTVSDKKLFIYSMSIQELDLKPFTKQNKMKLKEQDLKY